MDYLKDYYFSAVPLSAATDALNQFLQVELATRRPFAVLIGGASGVGKSSLALELAWLLGVRLVVSTDTIRLLLAAHSGEPALGLRSHQAWQLAGAEFNETALISGFLQQCELMFHPIATVLEHAAAQTQNLILEGVHLTPAIVERLRGSIAADILSLYLTTSDDYFLNVLLPRRSRSTYIRHTPAEYAQQRLNAMLMFVKWWRQTIPPDSASHVRNDSNPRELLRIATDKIAAGLIQQADRG